ncbi:MAG: hypothetical protein N2512_02565 [Armatimonadetes bacterium]|nr:hypothetical protein [Armatimonadota bacterium]
MKIATIAPLKFTPGQLAHFQSIRGDVGAARHQGPSFHQFADGLVHMTWNTYDFDEGVFSLLGILFQVGKGKVWTITVVVSPKPRVDLDAATKV